MIRPWARLIDEVRGKQHSLLADTIFEQPNRPGPVVLAIYLVTSSKGGISAMELKRSLLAGWRRGRDLRPRPGPSGSRRGGQGQG